MAARGRSATAAHYEFLGIPQCATFGNVEALCLAGEPATLTESMRRGIRSIVLVTALVACPLQMVLAAPPKAPFNPAGANSQSCAKLLGFDEPTRVPDRSLVVFKESLPWQHKANSPRVRSNDPAADRQL